MSWKEKYKEHLRVDGSLKSSAPPEVKAEVFIAKAKEVHGNKYDYSKAVYTRAHDQVTIICPTHGEFSQKAHNHLLGKGCLKCVNDAKTSNISEFIQKAVLVHGGRYSYEKAVYVNTATKLFITCGTHGLFEQTPNRHLSGQGCPECAVSNQNTIYLIEYLCAGTRVGTKVGITNNFDQRFSKLKTASPYDMEFVQYWIVDNPREIETKVLKQFTRAGSLGTYFEGSSEILEEPTEQIAQFIEGLVYASI